MQHHKPTKSTTHSSSTRLLSVPQHNLSFDSPAFRVSASKFDLPELTGGGGVETPLQLKQPSKIKQGGHKPGNLHGKYSGISLNMENSGNSVQPQGKIVTNKVFLVRHFKYLCKTTGDLLYCWSWCGMTLDEGHYYIYFFVAITYGKVSLWLWRKPGKLREFFSPTLWPPCRSRKILYGVSFKSSFLYCIITSTTCSCIRENGWSFGVFGPRNFVCKFFTNRALIKTCFSIVLSTVPVGLFTRI